MKPRAEFHGDYAYFVMHFPALRHTHKTVEQEIDFVIGKNFIITTRYEMVDPLHKFSKVFEVNSILDKSNLGDHAGFVFFYMLKKCTRPLTMKSSMCVTIFKALNAPSFLVTKPGWFPQSLVHHMTFSI
ncbi:hypothetical protein EBR66_04530 [bacterium]|nr:hypothetical protein [bacterium]